MSEDQGGSQKPHIKQAQYADHNFSPLESHPQSGKKLKSPYSKLPSVQFLSWQNDFLPNVLWVSVIGASLPRDDYLMIFREMLGKMRLIDDPERVFVTHNWLSTLSETDFKSIMEPALANDKATQALSSLRLIESLPDRNHWLSVLPDGVPENAWDNLAAGIARAIDHQSELATDIRWFKLMSLLLCGRMSLPEEATEMIEMFRQYPNYGDMRKVRPHIRAAEMACRSSEFGEHVPDHVPQFQAEPFWSECRTKTQCIMQERPRPSLDADRNLLLDELTHASIELADHADAVSPETGVNPRRDAAFGIPLYAMSLAMETASAHSHILAGGRLYLRSLVEAVITLRYLTKNDDETIWKQYRNYGMGQAKLAFLKQVREEDVPPFISLDDLHAIANDDTWLEFLDIDLGAWDKLSIRKMADLCDLKPMYDKYYSWSSAFVHSQWGAVRDTMFSTCLNPLHRFHRIFSPAKAMESVLPDVCKLINMMLDDLNSLYPTYKRRIRWHKKRASAESKPEATPGEPDLPEK